MKRKMMVLAALCLSCALATPVLAGNGGGNGSQKQSGIASGAGTLTQSQIRQQNQYRYQTNKTSETAASNTRSQLRTRDPLNHSATPAAPAESVPALPVTTLE